MRANASANWSPPILLTKSMSGKRQLVEPSQMLHARAAARATLGSLEVSRLWYALIKSPRSDSGMASRYFAQASGNMRLVPPW